MSPAEQLMKTVLEAWGEADFGPVRDALDENVVWKSASAVDGNGFAFGGEYRGRDNVIALLSGLSTRYFFRNYTAKEIISQGEIVWGLFDVIGSYFPSGNTEQGGKSIKFESAFRWRIRDGKILEAQTFFDTAALLAQQRAVQTRAA
jgi:ketosteroid isomerase-like protein